MKRHAVALRWAFIALLALLPPAQALAAAHIITVTGTFLRPDGVTPAAGTVTFRLSTTLRDTTTGKSYPSSPKTVTLDGSGHISIALVATDDPEITPTGGTYVISEYVDGKANAYQAVVPYLAPGGTADLASLAPSSGSLVYGVSFAQLNSSVAAALAASGNIQAVQTYPEGTPQRFFAFTPDGSQQGGITRGPLSVNAAGALFNSTWDNVVSIGWNMDSSGALIHSGEAGGGWFFEDDFEQPALTHLMEMYWQLKTSDASVNMRPVFVQFDRTTGTTTVTQTFHGAGGFTSINQDATQLEKFTGNSDTINVPIVQGQSGDRKILRAGNNDGTSTWDVVQELGGASPYLAWGNQGSFRTGGNTNQIGFFGTLPQSKATVTGPRGSVAEAASLLTSASGYGLLTNSTTSPLNVVTYSASMTPDLSQGTWFSITATNGTAFTVNVPSNPTTGERFTITVRNTSGGALGAATFGAGYKMGSAWSQPATGFSRSIDFQYDGTNPIEVGRTAADVAN